MLRRTLRMARATIFRRQSKQAGAGFKPTIEGVEERILLSTLPRGFTQSVIARGLIEPSGLVPVPDGRIFVIQQTGQVRVIQNGHLLPQPLLSLTTDSGVERGLIGITIDPGFPNGPFIYAYYTVPAAPGVPAHNQVSRFKVDGNTVVPGSEVALLVLPALHDGHHNGGSLNFGSDGKLYIAVGENNIPSNSQSLGTPLGKILRINPDGTIPTDNPFYNQTTGVNRAIWAIGLRNPFSTAVQPGTGLFYINDTGADTWEKIDKGVGGANYGWPITENAAGGPRFQNPLYVYNHGRNDSNGAAITAGTFYDPARPRFPRSYVGRYFFGDITGWVKVYNPANGSVANFATHLPPVLDGLAVDPSGALYVVSRGKGYNTGTILKIQYRGR